MARPIGPPVSKALSSPATPPSDRFAKLCERGKYPATAATATSSAPIAINVTGSPGATPNNMLASALVRTRDGALPSTGHTAANPSVCSRMRLCRSVADALSAIRIPISCTR